MAKTGFTLRTLGCLVSDGKPWSLCVGAGCSLPAFPSWENLAISLACQIDAVPNDLATIIKSKLSPDVIIQSAFEKSEKTSEEFSLLLSNELYSKFFHGLSDKRKKELARCLTETTPVNINVWQNLIDRVLSFGFSTSDEIAKVVLESYFQERGPEAIVSFNAELLLPSLINAHAYIDYGRQQKFIDYVTEPITSHYLGRLQYIFCHGVVQVPYSSKRAQKLFNVYDKLVFSENEYLQLANSSFAWQSNSFFNILTTSTVIFIGLSFTDANLRRWLSWIHASKKDALMKMGIQEDSTSHYWIEKIPEDRRMQRWYELSVAHLGIRIIWINDWSEVPEVLKKAVHLV